MKILKVKDKDFIILTAVIFLNLFIFQNCAPPKIEESNMSSSALSLLTDNTVKVDGRCGYYNNSCAAGEFLNIADSNTQSLWKCSGSGGGLSITCSSNFTNASVNGICDSKVNLCVQGAVVDEKDSSSEYLWQCKGFNNGSSDNCRLAKNSAASAQDGKCGSTTNSCLIGTAADLPDTTTNFIWSCSGVNGGLNQICQVGITGGGSATAACGAAVGTCLRGTISEIPDTGTFYLWKCLGSDATFEACSLVKPTCVLSVQPRTHNGEDYTYNLAVTNGFLPTTVTAKMYGTKAKIDGSAFSNGLTVISDANGTGENALSLNSISNGTALTKTFTNTSGEMAGRYTRSVKIVDPESGAEICQSNTVNLVLTPACGLTVNKALTGSFNLNQSFLLSYNFNIANEMSLGATPAYVVWYGNKTSGSSTVPDQQGQIADNASSGSKSVGPFLDESAVAKYTRYLKARDSNNVELCKSNAITYEITNAPAPVINTRGSLATGIVQDRSRVTLKGTNFGVGGDNIVESSCADLDKDYDGIDTAGVSTIREIHVSFPIPTEATSCTFTIRRKADNATSNTISLQLAFPPPAPAPAPSPAPAPAPAPSPAPDPGGGGGGGSGG